MLAAEAAIVGVDRDPRWIKRAGERAKELGVATDRSRLIDRGPAELAEQID